MELHRRVAWWVAPELQTASAMFLVKLLQPVTWRFDGLTARGRSNSSIRVRVCFHESNSGHPYCGQEFVANGRDLVAVQFGRNHN
jgi:hypothetical protein